MVIKDWMNVIKHGSDEVKAVTADTAAAVLTVQGASYRAGG